MRPHAMRSKIDRTSCTYVETSSQPRAMEHFQQQVLPPSHGRGDEFESRRVHTSAPARYTGNRIHGCARCPPSVPRYAGHRARASPWSARAISTLRSSASGFVLCSPSEANFRTHGGFARGIPIAPVWKAGSRVAPGIAIGENSLRMGPFLRT